MIVDTRRLEGVGKWEQIRSAYEFEDRTNIDLKDK